MKRFIAAFVSVFAVSVLAVCLAVNCAKSPVAVDKTNPSGATGKVKFSVRLDKEALAKALNVAKADDISLDSVVVYATAIGEAPCTSSVSLGGTVGDQTVTTELSVGANKDWQFDINSFAQKNMNSGCQFCQPNYQPAIVHSGDTTIHVIEGDNPTINMVLQSRYVKFVISEKPIPEGTNELAFYQGDTLMPWSQPMADTVYDVSALPPTDSSIDLGMNWVNVVPYSQWFLIVLKGPVGGSQQPMYKGKLFVPHILAGVDTSYSATVYYCGPSNIKAVQSFQLTLGAIPTDTIHVAPALSKRK